jgi:Spy/CpxP family protein refolding chaperone
MKCPPINVILLAVALTVASATSAQEAAPSKSSPAIESRLAHAKARLNLTPEQEPQLRVLFQEEGAKLRAMQAKYGTDDSPASRSEKAKEARAIREDFRTRLKSILTPEQMAEWEKMAEEMRAAAKEKRQQNR